MPDPSDFDAKRAEKLINEGFERLEEGDYAAALRISAELESLRNSACFDLAAQVHLALGEGERALRIVERGVEIQPHAWPNWQLLGSVRSDLGNYEGAMRAYEQALRCEGVWVASVRLNQAILLSREERFQEAHDLLEGIHDDALQTLLDESRVDALLGLGRFDEAVLLGEAAIETADPDTEHEALMRVAVKVQRAKLERGVPRPEVRRSMMSFLPLDPSNASALALIRETYGIYSAASRYYELLVRGRAPGMEHGETYWVRYHVVADSPERCARFVREFENLAGHGDWTIDEYLDLEPRPEDTQGVYWRSEWFYSPNDAEFE